MGLSMLACCYRQSLCTALFWLSICSVCTAALARCISQRFRCCGGSVAARVNGWCTVVIAINGSSGSISIRVGISISSVPNVGEQRSWWCSSHRSSRRMLLRRGPRQELLAWGDVGAAPGGVAWR